MKKIIFKKECFNNKWLLFLFIQPLFLAIVLPYISGEYVFAPSSYVSERGFRSDGSMNKVITPRDKSGAEDYLDQERVFLQFYRESIKRGELPFWNERTFGGVSQEDSMIFSYLSPLHYPWLLVSDDHIAKGLQILLLLNLGAFAVLCWAYVLNLNLAWTILATVFITLNPLALHFQAHTHQPALYFMGLIMLAAFARFLNTSNSRYLVYFFVAVSFAVIFNFLSVFFFACIALGFLGATNYFGGDLHKDIVAGRIIVAFVVFLSALGTFSFFLAPILLESHLVREPVEARFVNLLPWGSFASFVDTFSFYKLFYGVWLPFIILIPVFFYYKLKNKQKWPVEILGLSFFILFAILLGGIETMQDIFRNYFPGMKYSTNASFRMLYFANLCGVIVLAWLFQNLSIKNKALNLTILLTILGICFVNSSVYMLTLMPESYVININKLYNFWKIVTNNDIQDVVSIAIFIPLLFILFWYFQRKGQLTKSIVVSMSLGLLYTGMYQYQRPNLLAESDPATHPIFKSLDKGSVVITLEDCDSSNRSWYRSETAMGGFRSLDGPTDLGLFKEVRQFWLPLNDVNNYNSNGANLMEVSWICDSKVLDDNGRLVPSFVALARMLGIKYIFTNKFIAGEVVRYIHSSGDLHAYEVSNIWSDVTFISDYSEAQFVRLVKSLVLGESDFLDEYYKLEKQKITLAAERESNLVWHISQQEVLMGESGLLVMNHPNEYHRGFIVPFLNLPLEGKWQLVSNGNTIDFPLHDIPFRLKGITFKNGDTLVRYSLRHYYFWGAASVLMFFVFLLVLKNYNKWLIR